MINIMNVNMNNIIKYCNCKQNVANIGYNKKVTGGNDPRISKRMRYSQLINSSTPKTVNYRKYIELYGPLSKVPAPPNPTDPLFQTSY